MVLLQGKAREEYGQLRKEESLWRATNIQGNILALYPRGQTGKTNCLSWNWTGSPVPLSVPLGTAWVA